ncbi:hypothetical protein EXM22_14310 [Oceanispirochaeta crateris]|uniref:Transglutaminase domain-containing protein n=1 Tax=Oceanispirochaeta crateris TaxID=2518645 RepID=A0A5C1QR50_9SPIO|nr:hypothetical protein [Oceanispirochaeta crateris]QEN09094.1 hypothetical protein EXM22_14310 [Oceanispirochaeta crateris]
MIKRGGWIIFMILMTQGLWSAQWLLGDSGSSVFLPEGWGLYDQEDEGRIAFANPENSIRFQVTLYPGSVYDSDTEMMDEHLTGLNIKEKDLSRFMYQGLPCSLADILFETGGQQIRGWFLFIDRDDYDYYLTAITTPEDYPSSLPLILSCLDGFSPDQQGRSQPGPISALISSGGSEEQEEQLSFEGSQLVYRWSRGREEASRLLIEREATILSSYEDPKLFDEAWKRYYQMIYRDMAYDLENLAFQLSDQLYELDEVNKSEVLLSWLQDFQYGSTDRFSDLLTPTECLLSGTGDCDALALVYGILLNHLEIPAVLMVSREYSHALAAVAVQRKGAHFDLNGTDYVVAEMTKKVDLGQISADMSNLDYWVIVPFSNYIKGTLPLESSNN